MTLCVIDMQPFFVAAREDWLVKNVLREIESAKSEQSDIIVLEYEGCGPTFKCIKDALRNYPNAIVCTKFEPDGIKPILSQLDLGIDLSHIRLVGVETDSCIAQTCNSLATTLPNSRITVVADACNTMFSSRRYTGRKYIRRYKNVHVTKSP